MIFKHTIFLVFIAIALISPAIFSVDQSYPPLPIKEKKGKINISFNTCITQVGPFSSIGNQILQGMKLYLQQNKSKNFAFKHKGNLDISDLGSQSFKKITKFIKKSPLILGIYETRSLISLMPSIENKNVLALFPAVNPSFLRKQGLENIIYFRPPHSHELNTLIDYVVRKKIKDKIAIFYESSHWGDDVLKCLEKLLQEKNLSLVAKSAYAEGTVHVSNAVAEIAKHNPNAIFCIASPKAAYNFINQGINEGLHKVQFLGLSDLHIIQLLLKNSKGINIAVSSILPDPTKNKSSLAKKYQKASKQFLKNIPLSHSYFEGYVYMAIFVKILQKIQGKITIQKIIKAIKDFKNESSKDFFLRYKKETNSLSQHVWVNPGIEKPWVKSPIKYEIHSQKKNLLGSTL